MLKNFLLTTFRNFHKNKYFIIFNILGLGIALACCIVAFYNMKFDRDFDKMQIKKDEIYKISLATEVNGQNRPYGISSISMGPAIKGSISGVENTVRYARTSLPLRSGDNVFNKKVACVDENFFKLFNFPMLNGENESIRDKKNIIISKKLAGVLFGDKDPIGEVLTLLVSFEKSMNLVVSGVMDDIPLNSSLRFDAITLIDNYIEVNEIEEYAWKDWIAATFLQIKDKSNLSAIENQLNEYLSIQNEALEAWNVERFFLESLEELPQTGQKTYNYQLNRGLDSLQINAVNLMALLILILACLNFTNTALSLSNKRLKEIGIRNVVGGTRKHTIIQFLGENLILCFIALLVSLLIAPFLLTSYSDMWSYMDLEMSFTEDIELWLFLLGMLFITGILAGTYPAFYVSRFNPIKILKGTVKQKGTGGISMVLLVLQFILATTGIISTLILTQNAYFLENIYLGYDKEQIIVVPVDDYSKLEALQNKFDQNPLINKHGRTNNHINWGRYSTNLKCAEQERKVSGYDIGKGYFSTMGIQLKSGRYFGQNFMESERGTAVIVNEKLVEDYGWESAIGKRLRMNDTTELVVVGVMKNFYPWYVDSPINPMIFRLGQKKDMNILVIQANVENLDEVNEFLKNEWKLIAPNYPYPGFYQEETLAESKDVNRNVTKIFAFLGLVSVILSLVGLYTLVSIDIIKRTKEIGIRKVMGISIFGLILLLNRKFIILILIASILGSFLGYYLSNMLLESAFTYYVDFNLLSFIIPILFILIVTIITLSGKVYKAATANPVDSLKYE